MGTVQQFMRYVLVGGVSAAVDSACLYLLHSYFGVRPLAAGAIGFLLGLVVNYVISVRWVFKSTGSFRREFILFSVIGAGGLAWTELILWSAVTLGRAPVMVAKALALVLVLMWNFGMRKKFVFAAP